MPKKTVGNPAMHAFTLDTSKLKVSPIAIYILGKGLNNGESDNRNGSRQTFFC